MVSKLKIREAPERNGLGFAIRKKITKIFRTWSKRPSDK
jgi:hypothetical protein